MWFIQRASHISVKILVKIRAFRMTLSDKQEYLVSALLLKAAVHGHSRNICAND
jgi:hypothetical protein